MVSKQCPDNAFKYKSYYFFIVILHFLIPCFASLATRCVSALKNYFSSPESNKCNQYEYCSQALKYYINVPCGDILARIFKYIMKAQINIYQREAFMLCKTVLARTPIILSSKQGNGGGGGGGASTNRSEV